MNEKKGRKQWLRSGARVGQDGQAVTGREAGVVVHGGGRGHGALVGALATQRLVRAPHLVQEPLRAARAAAHQLCGTDTHTHTVSHKLTPCPTRSHRVPHAHTLSHTLTPCPTRSHCITPADSLPHWLFYSLPWRFAFQDQSVFIFFYNHITLYTIYITGDASDALAF